VRVRERMKRGSRSGNGEMAQIESKGNYKLDKDKGSKEGETSA